MSGETTPIRGRELGPGTYAYDEVAIGDWLETDTLVVETGHIDRFAELSGDRFEIHMSDAAARKHGFPGRVAHGLLVLSLVDGLKNRADATFRAIASLGWDWRFEKPVFIGDEIRVRLEIADMRETKSAERGILTLSFQVENQHGETVQSGTNKLMVYKTAIP
jgi:3-hydroxybutyryl-CoA dehydratase